MHYVVAQEVGVVYVWVCKVQKSLLFFYPLSMQPHSQTLHFENMRTKTLNMHHSLTIVRSRSEDLFTKTQVWNFSPGCVKALSHVIISVVVV